MKLGAAVVRVLKLLFGLLILSTVASCQFRSETPASNRLANSPNLPGDVSQNLPTDSTTPSVPAGPSGLPIDFVPGTSPEPGSSSDSLDLQCIKSLCGRNNPLAHPFELSADAEGAAVTVVIDKVRKPLQNYMGRVIHQALLRDQYFKQMFAAPGQIELTPEKAAFVLAARAANKLNTYMPSVTTDSNGRLKFDREKLAQILGKNKQVELPAILSLENFLNFVVQNAPIFDNSLELIIKMFYQNLDYVEAIKQEAIAISLVKNYIYQLAPSMAFRTPDDLVLNKAMTGQPLSFTEKNIFKMAIRQRFILSYLIVPEVQNEFKKLPLDVASILGEIQQTYLASKQAKAVANPTTIKSLLTSAVQTCATKLSYSYAALPSTEQMQLFKKVFAGTQLTAKSMIEERLKSSLTEPLDVQLILPPTRDEALQSWITSLQDAVKASDVAVKQASQIDMKNSASFGDIFLAAATFNDSEMLEPILEFCDHAKLPFLDDAAVRGMNTINLSWPTITHPRMGIGIVAHELGHIISGRWPDLVAKEQQCLQSKQGTQLYVEEDFADLFAAEIGKRTNFVIEDVPVGNYACSLLPRKEPNWLPGSLKNAIPMDPHSSGFFRLIATAEMSGRQTNECRNYLSSVQETRFSNYCAWGK